MKRQLITFWIAAFFILLGSALKAQESASIFWEISGKGLEKPSYLFGTHHLYDYNFIVKDKNIQQILQEVDMTVGEIVVDSTDFTLLLKMAMAMLMTDNTLDKLLSEQEYQDTDRCLKETMGIGIKMFNNFKPMALYQIIMVGKYVKVAELPKERVAQTGSMDTYFQNKAKAAGKPVKELESVDDQISVLYDGYSIEKQLQMLLDMVYDKESGAPEELLKLNQLYKEQDLQGLFEAMHSQADEEEMELLLNARNRKWIPKMEKMMQTGQSCFFAVGAGHLPGQEGVLNLLRQQGYLLRPLSVLVE